MSLSPCYGALGVAAYCPSVKSNIAYPYGRINFQRMRQLRPQHLDSADSKSYERSVILHSSVNRGNGANTWSSWDDEPHQVLPDGKRSYLDEQDVVSLLDPLKDFIPFDPSSYNPAAYLWKKIGDIPEERRHLLVSLLKPKFISRAWEVAGTRYDDPKLVNKVASTNSLTRVEIWNCRTSRGPLLINFFKKALFRCGDGKIYGRFTGSSLLAGIASSYYPLYFEVTQLNEVMSTEQPCDLAYEFGDGLFDLPALPQNFPKPAKHPWPFSDQVVIYLRHLGPGVMVGQAWQEGEALEQIPKKLGGEILMVKDY